MAWFMDEFSQLKGYNVPGGLQGNQFLWVAHSEHKQQVSVSIMARNACECNESRHK